MIRTDEEIKKSIVDHLYWDDSVDASAIKVQVEAGKAVLSGSVSNLAAKDAATAAAWLVPDIQDVENRLTVKFPRGTPQMTDQQIKENVTRVLGWNNEIHSMAISVSVHDGVVTLEGTVTTYWQRQKAERLVSDLLGVVDIKNKLLVIPTESLTDRAIAINIETAIGNIPQLDSDNLHVDVKNGAVTLSGVVNSWRDKLDVYNKAVLSRGVTAVFDKLVVVV
jgi:osmotically-inducible protein OsmY